MKPPAIAKPDQSEFPDRPTRIYLWFKFWNVIRNFFPYHHLTDRPWDDALTEFIPRFASARTNTEYALVAAEAATWMDDSHAGAPSPGLWKVVGRCRPRIEVRPIEGEYIVTQIDDAAPEKVLKTGDELVAVDGTPVAELREKLRKIIAYSTTQASEEQFSGFMLAGPEGEAQLESRRGKTRLTVSVQRVSDWYETSDDSNTFKVLPQGFGYFDLTLLKMSQLDEALEAVRHTSALIIDIRGYPLGTMFALAPRLTSKKVVGARFQRPEYVPLQKYGGLIDVDPDLSYRFDQTISPAEGWKYQKPIVALIDARAISHAEHSCLFLEASAENVTFIGTPTNGANGDVTLMSLPGGVMVRFTGHDVRHGDGRQLQRVGILPDIEVAPTIAGIRAGRDEVLEAAIAHLKKTVGQEAVS